MGPMDPGHIRTNYSKLFILKSCSQQGQREMTEGRALLQSNNRPRPKPKPKPKPKSKTNPKR